MRLIFVLFHLAFPHIQIEKKKLCEKTAWYSSSCPHMRIKRHQCKLNIFVDKFQIYGIFLCFSRSYLRSSQPANQSARSIDNITGISFNLKPTSDGANSKIHFAKCNNSENKAMHLSLALTVSNVLNIYHYSFYSLMHIVVL